MEEGHAMGGLEDSLWLCPIENRHSLGSTREGMGEGFSLGQYLLLVDFTGRPFREGKAAMSNDRAGIFDRLGSSAETWQSRLLKLSGRLLGRFLSVRRERLREIAVKLGVHPWCAPRASSRRSSESVRNDANATRSRRLNQARTLAGEVHGFG